jgi:hypothetical protein
MAAFLPDCLLSLVFGCLSWRTKLAVLNLVCTKWRDTLAAWSSLSLRSSDMKPIDLKKKFESVFALAQTQALQTLETFTYPRWLQTCLKNCSNLRRLIVLDEFDPIALRMMLKDLERTPSLSARPKLSLSLDLNGFSDLDLQLVTELLSLVWIEKVDFCSGFKGTTSLWASLLGANLRELLFLDNEYGDSLDFLKSLPGLRHLRLAHCSNIEDESLRVLPRYVSGLEKLNLDFCEKVTDFGLEISLSKLMCLTDLSLSHTKVTKAGLEMLSRTPLRKFNLNGCSGVKLAGLNLGQTLPLLQSLNLSQMDLADDDLSCLSESNAVESLELFSNNRITGTGLRHLGRNPLKMLDLLNCTGLRFFESLQLSQLRVLDLRCVSLSESNFFGCLNGLRSLHDLNLRRTNTRDADLPALLVLQELKKIDLSYCGAVSSKALSILSHVKNVVLEHLEPFAL